MYITSPKRKNGSTVVRLVESFWKEGKVKNRIIKTIGQSKDSKIVEKYKQEAKKLLEQHKKGLLSLSSLSEKIPIDLHVSKVREDITMVLRTFSEQHGRI